MTQTLAQEAEVLTEISGNVLIVTLNRPEAKNAMNKAAAEGIAAAMDRLDADGALRCAILTGAGGTFCSGMDLKGFLRGESPSVPGRGFGALSQWTPKKPIIAAVDGYALAGGMELALACDLIVAHGGAKFGIPEVKRGLAAAAGGLIRLPRQIPPRIAMELALTGDFITAQRAYELGFINQITEGPAIEAARVLAARIAENGPLALIASKAIVRDSHEWTEADMWGRQQAYIDPVFTSQDAREGAAAFAEKRKPNWQGK
ncbi:short chain enoyl-CoA hydratase [Novosphingobium nitrogenifigens DSM 19370]|uniref:Short chain enoyl-CoA hydratase n=1 Tax=Novosphingobium nitrogenifigens DSM 19370 TaxID=983920 RepID=F1Z835_9SPHN|nr:crotonase/enoyl-CoA hydratase family protein [Novosphingobium nitrogenifigens]EGD59190.1 short chain enoyl-CoA hydratase [Novosphingobium nitrogenifigens DSM 19370]